MQPGIKKSVVRLIRPFVFKLLASTGITNKVFSIQAELSQTQAELQENLRYIFLKSLRNKKNSVDIIPPFASEEQLKVVIDRGAGILAFPKHDTVMSEFIKKYGAWEPSEQNWIAKNVKEDQLVLNIGANIGVHAIVASKFVGTKGEVIAFECHPEIARLLALNLCANGIENVTISRKAVADFNGQGVLFCSEDNAGDNRLIHSEELGDLHFEVDVVRLETYLEDLNAEPHIIIMDIQGFELAAIRGLGNKLAKGGKILFEFTPRWLDLNLDVAKGQLDEILESGYKLFNLGEFGAEIPMTVNELMEKFTANKDLLYLNLVLCKA